MLPDLRCVWEGESTQPILASIVVPSLGVCKQVNQTRQRELAGTTVYCRITVYQPAFFVRVRKVKGQTKKWWGTGRGGKGREICSVCLNFSLTLRTEQEKTHYKKRVLRMLTVYLPAYTEFLHLPPHESKGLLVCSITSSGFLHLISHSESSARPYLSKVFPQKQRSPFWRPA